ncbi:Cytochrome C oxidase, cbb3-type, subunit III [Roseovarius litoreus]|jgi:mono/diheme cytochrome c family protein|uniref:Cytochrome C oxidase, cbb3-type, subunit III n=1 Tax=Roseovarius litoreus TaxID=1155722 RepID=A0A1M7KM56_9RHOB|nr:cytochrome c [Roseovarius litoreus]SHM66449.1 Cytochrome C oxidase, cbb3-type, subunit III [Roseovarius litoreus]
MKQHRLRYLGVAAVCVITATVAFAQQQRGDWWGNGHMGSGHMGSGVMHGWGWGQMNPGQQQRMQRHWTYMNQGVPGAYRGARSDVRATPQVIAAGRTLYSNNCASCHGAEGLGDGKAGRSLVPSPALLRQFVQMPMSGDEYLLWTISEGGERFGTDMPAFRETLSEEEIWKIIAYMRAGFP